MVADSRIPGFRISGRLLNVFPRVSTFRGRISQVLVQCIRLNRNFESSKFESLIYTSPDAVERVPADNLACAVDVHENLSLERLGESYGKNRPRQDALAKAYDPDCIAKVFLLPTQRWELSLRVIPTLQLKPSLKNSRA